MRRQIRENPGFITSSENQGSGGETLAGFWQMMGWFCRAVAD
jgi:hypothetical protein